METMADLGVTGILEMPPAGTLTGIAKRAAEGRRDVRAQDPRPARRRPRVRRQARRRVPDRHLARPGGCSSRPQGHLPPGRRRPRAPTTFEPGATIGEVASLRGRTTVTAAARRHRSSSGSSRTATWSPPASRCVRLHPESESDMTASDRDRHRRASTPRSSASAATARAASSPTPRSSSAIDSTDEWIQHALRHHRAPLGRAPRDRADDVRRSRRARRSSAPASTPRQIDCVIVATVSHLMQTPAVATLIADELGTDAGGRVRHLGGLRRLLPRRRPGLRHGPRRQRQATSWSSASSGSPTSPTRPTADGVHLRRRRGRGRDRAVRRRGHRPGRLGLRRRAVRPDPAERGLARRPRHRGQARSACRTLRMDGNPVFRWASFEMAKVAQRGPRPGRHHRRRPRRVRAPPGQHADHRRDGARAQAARARGRSPATSPTRATPRRRRSRSRSTALLESGEAKSGDLALLIAFGAGLAYAAQVVTLP